MGPWSAAAILLAVVGSLAGCASEVVAPTVPSASLYFPMHGTALGTGDAAALEGELVVEDDCLWIETGTGERVLPLWPSDVRLGMVESRPAILGPDLEVLLETGSRSSLGGSETDLERARELTGPIPEECASGSFWVVSTVVERP